MSFEVKLETFDGPLHLLLEIIESKDLPITEVSLSEVADAYLKHINDRKVPPDELADFLVVATRLLLLKSRAILPIEIEDEEEDPSTLALQLRLYKEFVEASKKLETLFDGTNESFRRAKADIVKAGEMQVHDSLNSDALHGSFTLLLKRLEPFFKLQQAAIERVVSVKERLREIHDAILSRASMTFKDVVGKGRSRVDVVVSFLALLELVKQNVVNVVQSGAFNEIEIKRID
jgi:segregation and condensation protein A